MIRQPFRYAVYWTPNHDSALADFGRRWLGRDAEVPGVTPPPLPVEIHGQDVAALTAAPRRYGFHATLKAPFRLAPGMTEDDLLEGVRDLAASHAVFQLPGLHIRAIGRFLAFVPSVPSAELQELAAACVTELDRFRAPMTAEEMARRKPESLDEAARLNLERWGYPYVLDTFRFHLTLTGSLSDDIREEVRQTLVAASAECAEPQDVSDIAVFTESAPGEAFTVLRRFPLAR